MKHLLALDIATSTGWCRWEPGASKPTIGSIKFDAKRVGTRNREAREWMRARILTNGVEVVVKEQFPPKYGDTTVDVLSFMLYMHGMVEEVCADLRIPCYDMPISTWRTIFLGFSRAPKQIEEQHRRRRHMKLAALKRCLDLGWDVKNDDEAEAAGIAYAYRVKTEPLFAQNDTPLFRNV